jgi:hypothetical protein
LIIAFNNAISSKATKINEVELAATAKDDIPNIPEMDLFKS